MNSCADHLLQSEFSGGLCRVSPVKLNGQVYAQKLLLPAFQGQLEFENIQRREFEILSRLDHPSIPKAFELGMSSPRAGVLTHSLKLSWVKGLTLLQLKSQWQNFKPSERKIFADFVLSQLVQILHYLRKEGLVHADISPENILITQEGKLVLIDFGSAFFEHEASTASMNIRFAGKPGFAAPELRNDSKLTREIDVYSCGRVYEELLGSDVGDEDSQKIELMLEKRVLPFVDEHTSVFGAFDFSKIELTKKSLSRTRVIPKFKVEKSLVVALPFFWFFCSTFQNVAEIQVNSLPFMKVCVEEEIDCSRSTPIIRMLVPAGSLNLQFVSPTGKSSFRREILLKTGEVLKFFEDFRNTDSL